MKADLRVSIGSGLDLANPVVAASGTWGYGDEIGSIADFQRLGAIVCKGTTLLPRDGNPQPRIVETPSGVLNAVGLQNMGVEALIKDRAPVWAKWPVPVIVNIAGESVEEYAKLASCLDGVAGVSGLEVNISCPNVKKGGLQFGTNPGTAAEVTGAVKSSTSLPVIVKLSPNVTDITEIALAVQEAGADALSLINTLAGMAIDVTTRKPRLGNVSGGLSGPAVKPVALWMVWKVAGSVRIPVIGCGGITTAEDALEFIMAGATAVEVGTANLVNPRACIEIIDGLRAFLESGNATGKLCDLRGVARH
jgi:dihydroorotate dehydrogenase (NAD+) catalytic subunit